MGLFIEDGKGRGKNAAVGEDNRLLTNDVSISMEHYNNHVFGEAYNLIFNATPTGAGDCFLYVKNESEMDMIIEGFWIKLAADEYIDIKIGDSGTASGGNAITPVNLNSGSGMIAEGTFQNGNDITGLSGGTTTHRIYHASSNGSKYWNFNQDIILVKNGTFTMYCETGTTALSGILVFNYHNPEV